MNKIVASTIYSNGKMHIFDKVTLFEVITIFTNRNRYVLFEKSNHSEYIFLIAVTYGNSLMY